MALFKKAERSKVRLKLSISGPSGSGKTYSALKIAFGLGSKVVLIDSENGSGSLYASLGDYDTYIMEKPYEPEKLINIIKEAEKEQYDVIIIDSLSHYWAGEGGLLERHEKIGGNSYTAWAKVTPVYQRMMETILLSKCHVIFTMRSKQDYVLVEKNGKQVPEKVGLAPIMRDGAEYDVSVAFNLNMNHLAEASKDRTGLFDKKQFTPTEETGKELLQWLDTGAETPPQPQMMTEPTRKRIVTAAKQLNYGTPALTDLMKRMAGVDKSEKLTETQGVELAEYLEAGVAALNETAATEEAAG